MLPEQLERFKESGRLISSRDLTDSYLMTRRRLVDAWSTSLSEDDLRREELYRQLRGLDAIMDQIVSGIK